MPDKKALQAADCWLHGQVVLHEHLMNREQTSYTKHGKRVLLLSENTCYRTLDASHSLNGISAYVYVVTENK